MFRFAQRKKEGWLAVGFFAGRIDFAHVERNAGRRPRLVRLESYARSGDDAAALATLGKQKGLAAYRITTLLVHDTYQLLSVDAPEVPEAELREAVRWGLKDMIEYPVEMATVDVLTLPVTQMAGRTQSLLAVSVSDTVLAPRLLAFDKSRIDLQAVDIPELAQRNIAALFEDENRGLAMLTLDASGGLLTFTYRGELCVSRHIDVTTEQLESANEERRTALFERIGLELQRSLDNFERQYTTISVSKVVVGPCSSTPQLVEYLRDYVYIPVSAADLLGVIDCDQVPELRDPALQAERLAVIGAALRDDVSEGGKQQIGLINSRLVPKRDWLSLPLVVGVGAAFVLVLAAIYGFTARENISLLKEEKTQAAEHKNLLVQVETLTQVLAEKKPSPELARQAETLRAMLMPREAVVRLLQSHKAEDGGFLPYLRGFSQQTLEGVWLTEFEIDKNNLVLRGRLTDPALLPVYIRRLNEERAFNGRRFATLEMKGVEVPETPAAAAPGATVVRLPRHIEFVLQTTPPVASAGTGGGE